MFEAALIVAIFAIVIGSNATVITLALKIFFKVGENTRDIKYIKQAIGMNCNKKE